jgi:DNA-directed RNA polymerase specialized sigma24 family protein
MTEEEFDELRPSAFAIAYRMLGSVSEAEDVVQEGFLRLHRTREGGERMCFVGGNRVWAEHPGAGPARF